MGKIISVYIFIISLPQFGKTQGTRLSDIGILKCNKSCIAMYELMDRV